MKPLRLYLGILLAISVCSTVPLRAAAPEAPDYVKVAWIQFGSQNQFLVRWKPVAAASGYNVYHYDTNTAGWVQVATNLMFDPWNVLSFRDPAAPDAGPATYAVSAMNAEGESVATPASVVPGPGLPGASTVQPDWWPIGYTFIDPQFSYSWEEGCDGMFEFSADGTNFTHGAWDTNIQMFHSLHVTNLTPGTVWKTRLTKVDPNGIGLSGLYPNYGIVTLFTNAIDVSEDLPNQITIGSYPFLWPAQLFTPALHGSVVAGEYPWDWGYTPGLNFVGLDTFQILDNPDGPPVTITLNVTNVNDWPIPSSFTVYVPENATTFITPPVTDIENDPYDVWAWDYPANGTLVTHSNSFAYTPNPNFLGQDPFTYFAMDEHWVGTAAAMIIVTNVNDAPLALNQAVAVSQDTSITFALNVSDRDGDPLTLQIINPPAHGSLTNTGLTVTYTPNASYSGPDSFSYKAHDGQIDSAETSVGIAVTATGGLAAPAHVDVAWIDNFGHFLVRWRAVVEATGYNVYRYDSAVSAWVQIATNLTFPPWNVPSFRDAGPGPTVPGTYAVAAVNAGGESGKVSDSVIPGPYNGPYFVAQTEWWPRGYTFVDPELIGTSYPFQFTDGMMEFTPDWLTFTHGAWNTNFDFGQGFHITNLSPATVYYPLFTAVMENGIGVSLPIISISTLEPPVFNVWEDTANYVEIGNYTWINWAQIHTAPQGTMTPGALPYLWTYTPAANFTGTDTFQILDNPDGPPVTVTMNVQNINDPPIAHDITIYVPEDTQSILTPPVTDIDSEIYMTMVDTQPAFGWAVGFQWTNLLYEPALNFVGTDEFTYFAADFEWGPSARVTVIVTNVNDAPVTEHQSFTTQEDTPVTFTLAATDVDGDPLAVVITAPPWTGTVTNTGLTVTYTPDLHYYGPIAFEFRISDGQTTSDYRYADILIEPVNDAPIADEKAAILDEDGPIAIALTGSDVDSTELSFSVVTPPEHGVFLDGIYTPTANYNGTDSFTFKANDGLLDSTPATVSITINAVNDAPVANAQNVSTPYNTAANITLTGSDVEGSALTFATLTPPANGTLTGSGANRTFTPNIGWSGTTSFTFKVNDGALDSATATVTITVAAPTGIPGAPSALTATAVSQNQINLNWTDNSNNEDGFKIERSSNGNSGWTQIATVGPNITTFSNTGLNRNTRYFYRVRAYNVLGNSAYSNTANARTFN